MSKEKSVLLELLTKVDDLKKEIDAFHPLPVDVEERIMQKFRLDWNYNSNAIEGNALNYGETVAFLMHGITAHGKPLKDYLDIKGHNEAINYLRNFVRNKEELTEAVIRELHKTILVEPYEIDAETADGKQTKRTVTPGAYKTQPNHVKTATGEMHYFASPEETPAKMHDLLNWYRKTREDEEVHPVVLSAFFHHRFVSIHPFDDGNGRMARLLMNLLLMQSNYPPVVIKTKDKNNYYLALSQADTGNTSTFVEYVASALIHSEEIYLKGARGENIDEPDDFDKEITLIKIKLANSEDKFEKFNSIQSRYDTVHLSFKKLLVEIDNTLFKIQEIFATYSCTYTFYFRDNLTHFQKTEEENSINSFWKDFLDIYKQDIEFISFVFSFGKYKDKKNPFGLSLECFLRFDEYDYTIFFYIYDHKQNLNTVRFPNASYNTHWLRTNSYDNQLIEQDFSNAKQVLASETIAYIKNSEDYEIIE